MAAFGRCAATGVLIVALVTLAVGTALFLVSMSQAEVAQAQVIVRFGRAYLAGRTGGVVFDFTIPRLTALFTLVAVVSGAVAIRDLWQRAGRRALGWSIIATGCTLVVFGAVSSVDPQISWCPHADPCPMWGLGAAQANVTEALLLTLIALGGSLTTSIALIGGSE